LRNQIPIYEGGLLAAIGLKNMAVGATVDATFVAPADQSQYVREVVAALEKSGRLEAKFTPAPDRGPIAGAYAERVNTHWLFDETLPLCQHAVLMSVAAFTKLSDLMASQSVPNGACARPARFTPLPLQEKRDGMALFMT